MNREKEEKAMTSELLVPESDAGWSLAVRGLLAWIVVVALIGFFAAPFLTPGQAGDFSSALVDFYHAIMIPVAALFLILCTFVFRVPAWVRRWVVQAGVVGAGLDAVGSLVRAYGDVYHSAGFGAGAWIQFPGTLIMVSVALVFLVGLALTAVRTPKHSAESSPLMAWALFISGVSALIAVALGGIFAASEVGLSWAGWAHALHENTGGFLGNVVTSHSHDMLPAFMAGIVLLAAQAFGYTHLQGLRRRVAQWGIAILLIGVVLMTLAYVLSSLGTYNIPALWVSGPQGVNGIAEDDFLTGLVGWGSLILMVSLWSELRDRARVAAATVRSRINPVRLAVFLTWICAMVAMIVYGYYIELHEVVFGGGALPAPGAINDQIFTRAHLLYVFLSLPVLAVFLLAAELTADPVRRRLTGWMAGVSIAGMLVSLVGLGWWTFATPGHAVSWALASGGHDVYVLGQALMLLAAVMQLFIGSRAVPPAPLRAESAPASPH